MGGTWLLKDGFVDSIVLVCAVLASLATGVLVAYGVCLGLFQIFRIHARHVAAISVQRVAQSTVAAR